MRNGILSALVAALVLVVAPNALAAVNVTGSGTTLTITDGTGVVDSIDVEVVDNGAGNVLEVTDAVTLTPGGSCAQGADSKTVDCPTTLTTGTVNLGPGNDYFSAGQSFGATGVAWTVNGDDGNDYITGDTGADILSGGNADDYITGGGGSDHMNGDGGSDTLTSDGGDTLDGGAGADYLTDSGGAGDTINGGTEDDSFYIPGDNSNAADGADTYDGGLGTDTIDYSLRAAGVTIDLSGGGDGSVATTSNGASLENDSIKNFENAFGPDAGSTITGNSQSNDLEGGSGNDTISGQGGDDSIYGYGGDDISLDGGDGADYVYGGDGDDHISGAAGPDTLSGGNGADTINGGTEADYVSGGDGGDTINGGDGTDDIDPGTHFTSNAAGSDGTDTVDGGPGDDTIEYGDRTSSVTVDLSGGGDGSAATTGNGESGENDSLKGLEDINGGSGNDTLTGNSFPNTIYDGGGADHVNGLAGDDVLYTRDGVVDTVNCGDGTDRITADVAGEFTSSVSDVLTGCETVNSDYTYIPPVVNTGSGTSGAGSTPPPPPPPPPPAPTFTNGLFAAAIQFSPKLDTVIGTATIATAGSSLEADLLFNGKLAKVTVIGKTVKKGLSAGVVPFTVKIGKKFAKALKKKKTLKVTLKVTIKPPTGTAFVKTQKIVMKRGKPKNVCGAAVRAHAAC